jgi:Cyclin-dependent kinase inhibitor 3 (CDKN3)
MNYRIDELAAGSGPGLLGLVCCPGHRLTPRMVVPALDSAERDFDSIASFGAGFLVTLMESRELSGVGLQPRAIAEAMQARKIGWRHLPIRNLSIPDAEFERQWQGAGAELRACLDAGGRVVLHCYAGLGRTGIIAARLLIEFGLAPEQAIGQVRQARPGSIETWEQEDYVRAASWLKPERLPPEN